MLRLPRKVPRGQRRPSAPHSAISATLSTQNEGGCEIVPRLPRKTKVDVRLCHACHVKRRWMCQAPRLPRKMPQRYRRLTATKRAIQCHKCHACLTKWKWMWDCATPATQNEGGCETAPHLPREKKVDVRLRHACHVKRRWMSPSAMPATQNEGGCLQVPRLPRKVPRGQRRPSAPHSAISATLSTQNEGGCEIVPRLPRKTKVDMRLCHACYVKRRWMRQVPRLPRKMPQRHRRPTATKRAIQCHKCHACLTKWKWMWDCATPAMQNEGGCETAPRLPREKKVDVRLRHTCHAKWRWMLPSATPATQSAAASPATNGDEARHTVP